MNRIDIQDIQNAVYHCLFYLIREVEEVRIDWSAAKKKYDIKTDTLPTHDEDPSIYRKYHRQIDESFIENLHVFSETWGSTSLGFNSIGAAAITTALTVIVVVQSKAYVYWGGQYAYNLDLTDKVQSEKYKTYVSLMQTERI
jgi:hypothetical protein